MRLEGQSSTQERELALLIDSVLDYAIFLLDPNGHIVTWNRGAERIKGYTEAEIVGRHISQFYTPEDRQRGHPEHVLAVARRDGRYAEEGWRLRKDGSRFWASIVITRIKDPDGRHLGFGKVTRDLTARRLAEERLQTHAAELQAANADLQQFRQLVSSVRDYAIFLLDPGGRVSTWNAGARHIKGYEATEIIGQHFSVFYTEADRARHHPDNELEIAAREGRYEEEGWRIRKDGTHFWAGVTITAVRDEDGTLRGYAKVTRDLSARREAEEALRTANEELDRFASVAAHDLSDPLHTIQGFADLLRREPLSEKGTQFVEHILATTGRMQRLVTSLLAYARAGRSAGTSEPVKVRAAIDNVLRDLAGALSEREANVLVDLPEEVCVLADPSDFELVVRNLVANALKFGPSRRPRVEISAAPDAIGWRVMVADDGPGIAEADRQRIFEAFERAHPASGAEGSGLGLAICERLARRHGGALGIDSEVGQGSRFSVSLPAADATA